MITFGQAIWLIVIYFLIKGGVRVIVPLLYEALFYGIFKEHTEEWLRHIERKKELNEKQFEKEMEEYKERKTKGVIGFQSTNLES